MVPLGYEKWKRLGMSGLKKKSICTFHEENSFPPFVHIVIGVQTLVLLLICLLV